MRFIAGRLCLDFTNTVGGRTDIVLRDKFNQYADLLQFAQLAGEISAGRARVLSRSAHADPEGAAAVLARATKLREAMYRLFHGAIGRRRPSGADIEILCTELSTARAHQRLALSGSAYRWVWDGESALDRVLWPVAVSAADLLSSADLAAVRECGGETCSWLFLDTSRNRRRRWCDMKICGNRAKVRQFRKRRG